MGSMIVDTNVHSDGDGYECISNGYVRCNSAIVMNGDEYECNSNGYECGATMQ